MSEGILEDEVEVEHLFFYGTPLSIATSEGHTGICEDKAEILRIAKVVKKDCIEALTELRRLARNAMPSKTAKEEGEQEKQEKKMYPHLKTIFDRIEEELVSKRRKYTTRHLVLCDTSFPHSSDPVSHDTFNVKPDFLLVDTSSKTPPPLKLETRPNWAQCLAFFEVKASEYDGPGRGRGNQHGATDTLSQGVDYARILLSSRPFQLYVFGIFFCGTKYQIAYFDRRGVILSPEHDLIEDLRSFVRLVVRLIADMTLVDLGKDPTVELIEPPSTQTQAGTSQRCEQSGSSQVFEFPQFSVKFGPESQLSGPGDQLNQAADLHKRTWTTQGMYIWSSHSYLGRGTSVFQVAQHSQAGKVEQHAILKTAWRSAERRSESYIYAKIRAIFLESGQQPEQIEGIPTALMGEDVVVGDPPTSRMLSIHFLRDKDRTPSLCSGLAAKDWILHRVVINDVGKPLWKYSCGEELIRALLAALNGHKALADRGILHRDISPGNILIKLRTEEQAIPLPSTGTVTRAAIARSEAPPILTGIDPQEATGFLTDFEYASLPNDDDWVNPQDVDSIKKAGMSGTAMFMASEVLHLIDSSGDHEVQRTVSHDLQSFLWTILYVVFKHTMDSLERTKDPKGFQRQIIEEEYRQMFSAISVKGLINLRLQQFKSHRSIYVQITPTARAPAPIEHLMRYVAHTDPILIDLIDTTWNLLASGKPSKDRAPPSKATLAATRHYG
ncbi:hypothetical protein C8Q77DRAFT_1069052 [Trametes polyzona]|nr:hypothetical protein C8Q77DRAFT_1069052 [Trametes polyzona]